MDSREFEVLLQVAKAYGVTKFRLKDLHVEFSPSLGDTSRPHPVIPETVAPSENDFLYMASGIEPLPEPKE